MARSGLFASHAFATGARLVRHDIGVALDGDGADATINGLYLADGDQLIDNHTAIDHAMPHCASHELYKGILAGKARGVFNGRIIVRQDAQKTDAKQTNRALLLSDEAQHQHQAAARDLRRRREVHARGDGRAAGRGGDVLPAGRGASTPAAARDMLLHAFAGDVLQGLEIPALRAQIESNLFSALDRDLRRLRSGQVAEG